ncbi:tankyrase-2-like [Trichogramma pretiosum]|uniref:tankyrase-2-like n=1 Tax=Trichogramma pretiosum TaxID=7493 RepID=UPI000C71BA96|nr:tankyrase-2-like [Trichogramma pretiosum]
MNILTKEICNTTATTTTAPNSGKMDSQVYTRKLRRLVKTTRLREIARLQTALYSLIEHWEGELPDLRNFFWPTEIDFLLTEDLRLQNSNLNKSGEVPGKKVSLIEFVVRSGYQDELCHDENKKPSLFRATALLYAAQHSFPTRVFHDLFRIYNKFDVNYEDKKSGKTHFHVACELGLYEVMEAFLKLGQDPNYLGQSKSIDPPLFLVIEKALYEPQLVKLLLEKGANPNLSCKDGTTPMHVIGVTENAYDLAELFFNLCEGNNIVVHIDARHKNGDTPLHMALKNNNWEIAELLLRRGADPNAANMEGCTPLHVLAWKECNHNVTKVLLNFCDAEDRPLRIDARDNEGLTPLYTALLHKNGKMFEALLRHGADPNQPTKRRWTSLHHICGGNEYDQWWANTMFKFAGDRVRVDVQDEKGDTPLHLAANSGNGELTKLLLTVGADPNAANMDECTPLHLLARKKCNHHVTKVLLNFCDAEDRPLRIDARDSEGLTPLFTALLWKNSKMFAALLKRGADPNQPNEWGWTPLHYICGDNKYNLWWASTMFKFAGDRVRVDVQDEKGDTPMQLAVSSGNRDLIDLLLR